ncbi:hypothetical protein HMPREF9103_03117 [Lentilactobacillus parafarraginis F0439]|uniref:Uncharacterized protein n=1 Tax=Lentilactobacillus parafarraginis F0439 TaxID=797515 RepID=G9ZTN2_9LACO|nr:hypothetical protein [Lentilactobacillus parafarraginis]EHL95145.1 hypothetical protein HMPREF9103_03117 [Lentilactobacillus parafarraginis F0439]
MSPKDKMRNPDFQKLLRIALADLSIRQTLLENDVADVNEEMRSLEKDDKLDKLDARIRVIKKDYAHYKQFIDPSFKLDVTDQYS